MKNLPAEPTSVMNVYCRYEELMPLEELLKRQHPRNPNRHPPSQIERLAAILRYQGVRHPIVLSKRSGLMTKGHGRLLSAIQNGWKTFPIEWQEYVSDEQEYADVVADNAIASWAELDLGLINAEIPELGPDFNIEMLGLKDFELEPADQDADAVPEVKKGFVKRGELWQLGTHRLLCGDATSKEDVQRLMNGEKADMVYTDPPYGMDLDTDYSKMKFKSTRSGQTSRRSYDAVIGDDSEFDPSHILEVFQDCEEILLWGADHYYWNLPSGGSFIIWDKRRSDNFEVKATVDNIFGSHFEACWTKSRKRREIIRFYRTFGASEGPGDGLSGNVITEQHYHPTQKPIGLHLNIFERIQGSNIVDLYLGSGSTLIACEKTNRKCFGMEIDPDYCSVIIERWQQFTGQKAVKL